MARRTAELCKTAAIGPTARATEPENASIDRERRDRQLRDLFATWDAEPLPARWDDAEMYDKNGLPR